MRITVRSPRFVRQLGLLFPQGSSSSSSRPSPLRRQTLTPVEAGALETSEREIPPPNAVPATPSLIKAIKRVGAAQRQARHSSPLAKEESKDGDARVGKVTQVDEPSMSLKHESSVGSTRGRRSSMDEWWKEVVKKSEGKYVEGGSAAR
ncbi:hypothetical protein JCM1840_002869 [Sporobolomyces johnsonii]